MSVQNVDFWDREWDRSPRQILRYPRDIMGNVGIIYKLMPEDVETDLDAIDARIRSEIPDHVTVNKTEKKPVAFGLYSLELQVIMDDKSGGLDQLDNFLEELEGVGSVSVVSQTLID